MEASISSMIERYEGSVKLSDGVPVPCVPDIEGREKTMAYQILRFHEVKKQGSGSDSDSLMHIRFDSMISHDITYVGIIQTARASGMKEFPVPYALTNCHNSLCAVGGTINEDDHAFGLSAAKKYGGTYVPANQAVIHQFAREQMVKCADMILGSDSHTRYGCFGTMGVGEGGGELVKQLLKNTYDIEPPEVVLVYVEGEVPHGIGPHDVAIALVAATFPDGFVKNKVLEFTGPGIKNLSMDFRTGIDVMTTETSCLSSIWIADDTVKDYYENTLCYPEGFLPLHPLDGACYDKMVTIHLDKMESLIAMPFHPSRAYTIHELQENPEKIFADVEAECNESLGGKVRLDLHRCIGPDGKVHCDQGIIAGCAGGLFENISEAADILEKGRRSIGNGYFNLSVYPASTSINLALMKTDIAADLTLAGAVMKPCFCGPCFGAGDTPANNTLSIRHTTRNFANREGSKPGNGQIAAVALMDARSIAATAANGGILTAATDCDYEITQREYQFDDRVYSERCYNGFGHPMPEEELRLGPNIRDWPKMPKPKDNLLLQLCAVIHDEVTTTDELIPSGETSSYRSNPIALSEFALSRRVPDYVERSKKTRLCEEALESSLALMKGEAAAMTKEECDRILDEMNMDVVFSAAETVWSEATVGSCIFARKPGDGSAREQAASCQKVLGGFANICYEYATKRYRSNCLNWGIIPFTIDKDTDFPYESGDWIFVPGVISGILKGQEEFDAIVYSRKTGRHDLKLYVRGLSDEERRIVTEGCLMNYYAAGYGAD